MLFTSCGVFNPFKKNRDRLIPVQQKINEIKKTEMNEGSIAIDDDVIYVYTDNSYKLAQPAIFQRRKDNFVPPPRIWYYYSIPDSIVRQVKSRWYDAIYHPTDGTKAFDSKRLPKYKELFNDLTDRITQEINLQPTEKIPEKETDQILRKYWETINKWENDKYLIELIYFYAIQNGKISDLFVELNIEYKNKQ